MYTVILTDEAQEDVESLPITIHHRVMSIIVRLEKWPSVSGAKPLKHSLKGSHRVRTGDWRVLFTVDATNKRITVWKISNRKTAYED